MGYFRTDQFCKLQGLVVFSIDGDKQTLDLRGGKGKTYKGMPENGEKPELTLTISDDNFVKLVMGKLGPQQVRDHYRMKGASQQIVVQALPPQRSICGPGQV